MEMILNSNLKTTRLVGSLYIIIVSIAIYGMGYIPSRIIVSQNVAATTNNLLSNEFLFRIGIVCHLACVVAMAIMVLMLFHLFSPVDKNLSRFMVVPVLMQVPIVLVLEILHIAALMILKGETWMTIDVTHRKEFSYFMLRMYSYGIGVSQIFWGLWLFPFGILVYRSGFIPGIFAFLLIINGIGYLVEGCAFVLLQKPDFLLVRELSRYTFIGLPLTMFWFLIKGVR